LYVVGKEEKKKKEEIVKSVKMGKGSGYFRIGIKGLGVTN
jgi:hypothetical protein